MGKSIVVMLMGEASFALPPPNCAIGFQPSPSFLTLLCMFNHAFFLAIRRFSRGRL